MNKYFSGDSIVVPTYIFGPDDVTPAPAIDVTWEVLKPDGTSSSAYVAKPSAGPTVTEGVAGVMTGTYQYVFSNVDGNGFESATSVPSSITVAAKKVNVDLAANGSVTSRKIYRRKSPNEVYRLVSTQGNGAVTFLDNTLEDDETNLSTPTLTHLNTMAKFVGPTVGYTDVGLYKVAGQFTLSDGSQKTTSLAFQIVDPLAVATTNVDLVINMAWGLLEDCFDSVEGGPYLQDVTKAIFDEEKFADFFDLALFNISIAQPPVTYDVNTYPYTSGTPLLAKGILLEAIKHLMRSYVEQPLPVNDPTMHLQRRDYLDRWKLLYDLEKAEFDQWLLLFKRDAYGFGQTAMLVGGQSGLRTPRILRTRYPRFAGGWWGRF